MLGQLSDDTSRWRGFVRTILIVDDDDRVRWVMARELAQRFVLIEAASYPEALKRLRCKSDLAALVTDFQLGAGASGLELLQITMDHRPGCARVLLSGAVASAKIAWAVRTGLAQAFIAKPWKWGELLEAVVLAIDATGQAYGSA